MLDELQRAYYLIESGNVEEAESVLATAEKQIQNGEGVTDLDAGYAEAYAQYLQAYL